MCVLSCVQLTATPWTVPRQAPLSMEFSRQEYWSGLPFPTPGDLSDPGIEPESLVSPALASGFFTTDTIWEASICKLSYSPNNHNDQQSVIVSILKEKNIKAQRSVICLRSHR